MTYLPARRSFTDLTRRDQRQLIKAEQSAQQELMLHDLRVTISEIKAGREIVGNFRVNGKAFDAESEFYDYALSVAGQTAGKQRLAAHRVAVLQALNDDVVAEYCR